MSAIWDRHPAAAYIAQVVEMLQIHEFGPRDDALIYASLAQAEATLELAARFEQGLALRSGDLAEELHSFSIHARSLGTAIQRLVDKLDDM